MSKLYKESVTPYGLVLRTVKENAISYQTIVLSNNCVKEVYRFNNLEQALDYHIAMLEDSGGPTPYTDGEPIGNNTKFNLVWDEIEKE